MAILSLSLIASGIAVLLLGRWTLFVHGARARSADHLPSLGGSNFASYFLWCLRSFFYGTRLVQEGFEKHGPLGFKIPTFSGFDHYITDPALVEEYLDIPRHELSFHAVAESITQEAATYPSVVSARSRLLLTQRLNLLVRTKLSGEQQLQRLFPQLHDEVQKAFEAHLPASGDGRWSSIKLFPAMRKILAQTENRVFVGAPLCRDPEYVNLVVDFTGTQIFSGLFVSYFPEAIKRFVAWYLTPIVRMFRRHTKFVVPVIERRKSASSPDSAEFSLIGGLLDAREGWPAEELANKLLRLNFGAIHTSSSLLTDTIYELSARPDYVSLLCSEIESSIASTHEYSVATIESMPLLDSFIKETQRVYPLGVSGFSRKTLKPVTFSNGTCIPAGNFVHLATLPMTCANNKFFTNPREFDERRFVGAGQGSRLTATSPYLAGFGYGKTACVGRFFAALMIKVVIVELLRKYELRSKVGEGRRPMPLKINMNFVTNPTGEILVRRRDLV